MFFIYSEGQVWKWGYWQWVFELRIRRWWCWGVLLLKIWSSLFVKYLLSYRKLCFLLIFIHVRCTHEQGKTSQYTNIVLSFYVFNKSCKGLTVYFRQLMVNYCMDKKFFLGTQTTCERRLHTHWKLPFQGYNKPWVGVELFLLNSTYTVCTSNIIN